MDTLTLILIMVALSAVMLLCAVLVDRRLQARLEQRRLVGENPDGSPRKRDAADAFIDILNRSGEMVRKSMEVARGEGENSRPPQRGG
jgi:hypothetical protein